MVDFTLKDSVMYALIQPGAPAPDLAQARTYKHHRVKGLCAFPVRKTGIHFLLLSKPVFSSMKQGQSVTCHPCPARTDANGDSRNRRASSVRLSTPQYQADNMAASPDTLGPACSQDCSGDGQESTSPGTTRPSSSTS